MGPDASTGDASPTADERAGLSIRSADADRHVSLNPTASGHAAAASLAAGRV
jgi:hypothetical protein